MNGDYKGPTDRYQCVLGWCGWRYETPAHEATREYFQHIYAVVRAHFETHTTDQWVSEIAQLREAASRDARQAQCRADLNQAQAEEIERLRDWMDGCQGCGLVAYDAAARARYPEVTATRKEEA